MSGKPLYPPADSLLSNNYPPLSFYVVGIAGRVVGDNVIAGRMVALASFLAVGLAIFLVVMATTRSPSGALFGALVFGVYALMHFPDYIAWTIRSGWRTLWPRPALPCSCGAATRRPRRPASQQASSWRSRCLVKHTLIVLPAALLLELLLRRTRPLKAWAAGFGLTGLVSAIVCVAMWGALVFIDVLLAPRAWSIWYCLTKRRALSHPSVAAAGGRSALVVLLGRMEPLARLRRLRLLFVDVGGRAAGRRGRELQHAVRPDHRLDDSGRCGRQSRIGCVGCLSRWLSCRAGGAMAMTILVPAPAVALGRVRPDAGAESTATRLGTRHRDHRSIP